MAKLTDLWFPPHVLRQYSVLADGRRAALVGPWGDIGWLCVPTWDSNPVFSALVGGTGLCAVTPHERRFVWGGYYEHGSLIWNSRWVSAGGIVESTEALAYPGEPHKAVLLRRIRAVAGPAYVDVVVAPRADFGAQPLAGLRYEHGIWTARSGNLHVRVRGLDHAGRSVDALHHTVAVPEGETRDLVVEISATALTDDPPEPSALWEQTRRAWSQAVPPPPVSVAERDVRHSLAVLHGLTTPGGGMVAAATTSLPERADAGRNYDYRYAWIRDQCFAGNAAAAVGDDMLLDAAVGFVGDRLRADGTAMRPAYTVDGRDVPTEKRLDDPPGYPGAAVRTGNWVRRQFQLDVFGEALVLFGRAAQRGRLDGEGWRAVNAAVAAIEQRWREADSGIWELPARQWTESKLMCVAGLRAVTPYAPARLADRWSDLPDAVLADAQRRMRHPTGRWQRADDDPGVDAALLLPALRGALPATDSRTRATLDAVLTDLAEDGYLYRFRPDERPLGAAEGAFLLCGIAAAMALHQQGDAVAAAHWFERSRAACGPPGLFAEEYDVGQRQLRGNLPQAFIHAILAEAAAVLSVDPPE